MQKFFFGLLNLSMEWRLKFFDLFGDESFVVQLAGTPLVLQFQIGRLFLNGERFVERIDLALKVSNLLVFLTSFFNEFLHLRHDL
jgi:hypothetical protein